MTSTFGNTATSALLQEVWEKEPDFESLPEPGEGDTRLFEAPPFIGRALALRLSLEEEARSDTDPKKLKINLGCAGLLKSLFRLEMDVLLMDMTDQDHLYLASDGWIWRKKQEPKEEGDDGRET